jgi:hypothetical protein
MRFVCTHHIDIREVLVWGKGGGEEYIELLKKLGMRKQMEVQKHPQTWVDFMDEL